MIAGASADGKLVYSLDGSTYSKDIPKGTDATTYTVYYKAATEDLSHVDSDVKTLEVNIKPTDIEDVTAPVANKLTYTGEKQALVTAGKAEGGTLEYSLDGETFSTDIPTAVNAGEYQVFYRVVGDDDHHGIAAKQVTVNMQSARSRLPRRTRPVLTARSFLL